jgi:hypothetical protein
VPAETDLHHLLDDLTLENWTERRTTLFETLVTVGPGPVQTEKALEAIAEKLGATKKAVAAEWQAFLGPAPDQNDNAAAIAVRLATDAGAELWHTPDRQAWLSLHREGHLEHHPLRSREARTWMAGLYYGETGKALYSQALQDALGVLEARALFEGPEHRVHTRLAEHEGRVYLDLTRPDWQVVEVDAAGWKVIPSSAAPVRFRRSPHQQPLPLPQAGEGLEEVLGLIPLRERRDTALVLGWLVGALNPQGPYPILTLLGSKGAGKSSVARILKSLVDPTEAPLRAEPKDVEALMVAAVSNQVLALDNLSKVPPWLSDALCRLSTGGGLSKRQLYTDADEHVLDATRPVTLTGIALGVLRDDLADRTATIHLERLEDGERLPERLLRQRFERAHAKALGQLLTAVSLALREWEATRSSLASLPRLADWAVWAEAAAPALGLKRGEITEAFFQVQAGLEQDLIESDPVAQAILALVADWPEGESREYATGELLKALEEAAGLVDVKVKPEGWSRSPQGLGKHLPRIQTALRGVGIQVTSVRDTHNKALRWVVAKLLLEKEGKQYPQYPQTPQGVSGTAETPAGIVNSEGEQYPQYPQGAAGIAGIGVAAPAQYPQEETSSRTEDAGIAGIAGIDKPPSLNPPAHTTPEASDPEDEGGDIAWF